MGRYRVTVDLYGVEERDVMEIEANLNTTLKLANLLRQGVDVVYADGDTLTMQVPSKQFRYTMTRIQVDE